MKQYLVAGRCISYAILLVRMERVLKTVRLLIVWILTMGIYVCMHCLGFGTVCSILCMKIE